MAGDQEENLAQGYLILVQAILDYPKEPRASTLEQYIVSRVTNGVIDFTRENKLIRVPARSGRKGYKGPKVAFVGTEEALLGQRREKEKAEVPIITDPLDKEILTMRVDGLTDKEIGQALGYSTSFIRTRRISALERIDETHQP